MLARAISKYNRVSSKKARLLTRVLKGMTVAEAFAFLRNTNKRASLFIHNTLKSAFDNARKKDPNIKETDLYISKIVADGGPMMKRFRAASMGRATMIRKRMSHITVHLDAKEAPAKEKEKAKGLIKKRGIFKRKKEASKKSAAASAKSRKSTAAATRK
jgi:large subunit ribosomal protein L22